MLKKQFMVSVFTGFLVLLLNVATAEEGKLTASECLECQKKLGILQKQNTKLNNEIKTLREQATGRDRSLQESNQALQNAQVATQEALDQVRFFDPLLDKSFPLCHIIRLNMLIKGQTRPYYYDKPSILREQSQPRVPSSETLPLGDRYRDYRTAIFYNGNFYYQVLATAGNEVEIRGASHLSSIMNFPLAEAKLYAGHARPEFSTSNESPENPDHLTFVVYVAGEGPNAYQGYVTWIFEKGSQQSRQRFLELYPEDAPLFEDGLLSTEDRRLVRIQD